MILRKNKIYKIIYPINRVDNFIIFSPIDDATVNCSRYGDNRVICSREDIFAHFIITFHNEIMTRFNSNECFATIVEGCRIKELKCDEDITSIEIKKVVEELGHGYRYNHRTNELIFGGNTIEKKENLLEATKTMVLKKNKIYKIIHPDVTCFDTNFIIFSPIDDIVVSCDENEYGKSTSFIEKIKAHFIITFYNEIMTRFDIKDWCSTSIFPRCCIKELKCDEDITSIEIKKMLEKLGHGYRYNRKTNELIFGGI